MKEIFEKIVLDSVNTIKDKAANEIKSSLGKNSCGNISGMEEYNSISKQISNNIGMINAYSRNRRLNIMVTSAALGLVFCLVMLTSYKGDLPGEVVGIISTVSGIFGACLKDAYSFEFGSSRGSKDKDEKISTAILERLHK